MEKPIALTNYLTGETHYDTLHKSFDRPMSCTNGVCKGSHMEQWHVQDNAASMITNLRTEAEKFLSGFYSTHSRAEEFHQRWDSVLQEINTTGTYELTNEELKFGVQTAWRNASRCSARIQWKNLDLLDRRKDVNTTDEMFEAICDHLKHATNGGTIKSTITVFRHRQPDKQDLRLWNFFTVSYAGYNSPPDPNNNTGEGMKIGDQSNVPFTKFCERLGWQGKGGMFDVLPLVLSDNGVPKLYNIPQDIILEVAIRHPTLREFDDLNLKWYAIPSVGGMLLEIGGLQFPAVPFNGWYNSIEIVRDFLEEPKYGLLETMGERLQLDTSTNQSLWKDRVALELNHAILESFNKAGVTIVDQFTVSDQFQSHLKNEMRERGGCPADWVWLTPSQSGSLTPLFHQEMLHYHLSPSYERQHLLWTSYRFPEEGARRKFSLKNVAQAVQWLVRINLFLMRKRPGITIWYATETGTAKRYALKTLKLFSNSFNAQMLGMDKFDKNDVPSGMNLFITSTFGNGDPPNMAQDFSQWLEKAVQRQQEENRFCFRRKATLSTRRSLLAVVKEESSSRTYQKSGLIRPSYMKTESSISLTRQNMKYLEKRKSCTSMAESLVNISIKYSVFALGSSAYPHFCGFGKWLDEILFSLGGERLSDLALGDDLGDRDNAFKVWLLRTYQRACLSSGVQHKTTHAKEVAVRWFTPEKANSAEDLTIFNLSKQHSSQVSWAKISDRDWLTADENDKKILISMEIMSPNESDFSYQPGDHAAVFPVNSDEDVDLVLKHLNGLPRPLDRPVILQENIHNTGWKSTDMFSTSGGMAAVSLRSMLKHHLSLRSLPSQDLLTFLSKRCTDSKEASELIKLSSDYDAYQKWRLDEPGIVDVFIQYPSLLVNSAELIHILPPLLPRLYSIASSKEYLSSSREKSDNNQTVPLDLLLSVVEYKTPNGRQKKGFCSNFMANLKIADRVAIYLKSSPTFHFKSIKEGKILPTLLIGAGSGLAPFRGFWQTLSPGSKKAADHGWFYDQARRYLGLCKTRRNSGQHQEWPIQLFFGCKNKNGQLLENETKALGLILERSTAFSQLHGKKEHVQDLVLQNSKLVFEYLYNEGGMVYVCGKVSMAESVTDAIIEAIDQHMTEDDKNGISAAEFVNSMKDDGRFKQDIFGK